MITAKEIGQFIAHPEKVGTADIEELKSLSDKYPYAQIFSILYLKGMQASNSVDFEAALRTHSYRISDRAQLYALIKEQEVNLEEPTLSIPSIEATETEPTIDDVVEAAHVVTELEEIVAIPEVENEDSALSGHIEVTEKNIEEEELAEIRAELPIEPQPTAEEHPIETEETTPTVEEPAQFESIETEEKVPEIVESIHVTEEELEAPKEPTEKHQDRLEESILHHALANNYQLDALSEEEEKALSERLAKEKSEIPPLDATQKIEETPEVKLEIESEQTFTNWLHANRNYSTPETTDKDAIASVVSDFEAFDPMESLFGVNEKPKQEFYSPAKKAKESLSEKQLPVSETLAKIYLMQGNYPKAIEAYKELSLAFPEKKIFFANQIEDLNKKLNK